MTVKGVLNAIPQFCHNLFWPQWGSKCRKAQEEYERMLEEEHINSNSEKVCCPNVKV